MVCIKRQKHGDNCCWSLSQLLRIVFGHTAAVLRTCCILVHRIMLQEDEANKCPLNKTRLENLTGISLRSWRVKGE